MVIYLLTKLNFKNNYLTTYRQKILHFREIKELNQANLNFKEQHNFCPILRHLFKYKEIFS